MTKNQAHGGARPGAGAKRTVSDADKRIPKPVTLPGWLWEWIDKQPGSRGAVIEQALNQQKAD